MAILLKLAAQILDLPLSSPNVNADFLHQVTLSETIALLILLGAEKQNLFWSMFVKNSMFLTSTKVEQFCSYSWAWESGGRTLRSLGFLNVRTEFFSLLKTLTRVCDDSSSVHYPLPLSIDTNSPPWTERRWKVKVNVPWYCGYFCSGTCSHILAKKYPCFPVTSHVPRQLQQVVCIHSSTLLQLCICTVCSVAVMLWSAGWSGRPELTRFLVKGQKYVPHPS